MWSVRSRWPWTVGKKAPSCAGQLSICTRNRPPVSGRFSRIQATGAPWEAPGAAGGWENSILIDLQRRSDQVWVRWCLEWKDSSFPKWSLSARLTGRLSIPDCPTVHPGRPDCPPGRPRLSIGQSVRAARLSIGSADCPCVSPTARARAAPTVAGVSRAAHASPTDSPWAAGAAAEGGPDCPRRQSSCPPRQPDCRRHTGVSSPDELDCPLTRRDCPPVSRKSAPDCPPGQPRLPIELGPTAHVSRVRQPESAARLSRCQLDCPLTTLGHRDHLPAATSYSWQKSPLAPKRQCRHRPRH